MNRDIAIATVTEISTVPYKSVVTKKKEVSVFYRTSFPSIVIQDGSCFDKDLTSEKRCKTCEDQDTCPMLMEMFLREAYTLYNCQTRQEVSNV